MDDLSKGSSEVSPEYPGHHSCFSPLPLSYHLSALPVASGSRVIYLYIIYHLSHSCFWHLWALRQT